MDHTYSKCIKSESELHPVLMSEPAVCGLMYIYISGIMSISHSLLGLFTNN